MFSSPQPNKANANSESNGHRTPAPPLPDSSNGYSSNHLITISPQLTSPQQDEQQILQDKEQFRDRRDETPRQRFTLRRQLLTTIMPVVLAPLTIAGGLSWYITHKQASEQAEQQLQSQALLAADTASAVLKEGLNDMLVVANNPLTINAARAGTQQSEASGLNQLPIAQVENRFAVTKLLQPDPTLNSYLQRFAKIKGFAEIFFTERNGFNIAYSNLTSDFVQRDEEWWQKVKSQGWLIGETEFDKSAKTSGIHLLQAIADPVSGAFLGVIKGVFSTDSFSTLIQEQLKNLAVDSSIQLQILDIKNEDAVLNTLTAQGSSDTRELLGGKAVLQRATALVKENQNVTTRDRQHVHTTSFELDGRRYTLARISATNLVSVASIELSEIRAAGDRLALSFLGLFLVLGGVAAGIILYLVRQLSAPLNDLSSTTEQVASGNLDAYAQPSGTTETQTLAQNFNNLVARVKDLLQKQESEAERSRFLADIAYSRVRDDQDLESVFNKALQGTQQILKADRVFLYRFNSDWSGNIIAEAVAPAWTSCLGAKITDSYFTDSEVGVELYKNGRVFVIDDIYKAGLADCHVQLYERFGIKANVIVPVVKGDQLMGLMCTQQCSEPRAWQKSEINFLTQLAAQLGLILDGLTFLEQQKTAKEQLQERALELLMQVEPISKGNLTIRASVTADEIGTIADSYNATVASLRKIVTQVQATAMHMATTTSNNEVAVCELSKESRRQTQEISAALDRIQEMSNSIHAVATSAQQAEAAVQQAQERVQAGDAAMNRTVDGIMAIRETVAQTSKKVKRLGESSQKISKVVNLIGTFAEQTNLLALNAAIEAANAGEQGRGFAVVAQQVRSLARQSTAATAEIESLVRDIQTETNSVVAAMEAGTEQVVAGTKFVDETRLSLNKITAVSNEISALVTAIASATVAQSQASEAVSQTITDVAAIAQHTSTEATVVSTSFQELLALALELQASAGQFKVS